MDRLCVEVLLYQTPYLLGYIPSFDIRTTVPRLAIRNAKVAHNHMHLLNSFYIRVIL